MRSLLTIHRGELEEEPPVTPPDPGDEWVVIFRQAWVVRHLVVDRVGIRVNDDGSKERIFRSTGETVDI